MFYRFYEKPGALYFGREVGSGYMAGVSMTLEDLRQMGDTISSNTDFQRMLDHLQKKEKTNPAPKVYLLD